MRLSEKTIELNFASQMNAHFGGRLIWFGLTQEQEARAGFDIATNVGSGLFIVQMKASNRVIERWDRGRRVRVRQFKVPHDQLQNLRRHALPPGSVFYGFPALGTTLDLARNRDVFNNTWLCDVTDLGSVGPPTIERGSRRGALRLDGSHYVDVQAAQAPIGPSGVATFHSEPVDVKVRSGPTTFGLRAERLPLEQPLRRTLDGQADMTGLLGAFDSDNQFAGFWQICQSFQRKAFALVVVDATKTGG